MNKVHYEQAPAQVAPPENLIIHMGYNLYLVPRMQTKEALFNFMPLWLRTHQCEEAKRPDNQLIRAAIKGVLVTLGPKMLKRLNVQEGPNRNDDLIGWWLNLMINIAVDQVSREDWSIHVKPCEECGAGVYKVLDIAPFTIPPQANPNISADHPSLHGGNAPGGAGAANSNELARSMGRAGDDGIRQNHMGA